MKHLLALLMVLILAVNLKSQDYIPFPLENTSWFNGFYQCDDVFMNCLYYGATEYYTNGDTLINGFSMTKILTNGYTGLGLYDDLPPTDYVGAIREDSSRVYLVPWYQEQEMLLFDFTIEIGDEIQAFAGGWEPIFLVQDVTYEDFSGITRKVIHLDYGRWIEGIGSDRGLFWETTPNLSGYFTLQECVRINGEIVFNHEDGEHNCSILSVSNKELNIYIYPNPNNGQFKIEGLNGDAMIELLDYSGRKIGESRFLSENGEVNFQDAHPVRGIYFAKISFGNSVRMVRISID